MAKTNEQILRALLKELNPIETAILRERIYKMCEITLRDIDSWQPNAAFIVSNETYKRIIIKIQGLLNFEDAGEIKIDVNEGCST
jgi:hypothetical protein